MATESPGQAEPVVNVFISDIRGQNVRQIWNEAGANAVWLDAVRLLITVRDRTMTKNNCL